MWTIWVNVCTLLFICLRFSMYIKGETDFPLTVVLKSTCWNTHSLYGNFFLPLGEMCLNIWKFRKVWSGKIQTVLNIAVCLKCSPHLQICSMQYKLSKCYCHSDIRILCFIFSRLCILPRQCENLLSVVWCHVFRVVVLWHFAANNSLRPQFAFKES